MRITRKLLLKLAKENVEKRIPQSEDLVAVYMLGSILTPEPLLGGTTDIDLVFVHKEDPPVERESGRITYEISLDIAHHHQSFYAHHRRLRLNPWLGPALCKHNIILHDSDHWLEYIQAGVSSQFNNPENIIGRAVPLAEQARALWFSLEAQTVHEPLAWFEQYFKAIGLAANAIAVLNGPGLTTRRFLLDFPQRADAIDHPGLYQGLLGLIGADTLTPEKGTTWREAWLNALKTVSKEPDCPFDLHPYRRAYYLEAYDALLESDVPQAALWPLLDTWLQAITVLWKNESQRKAWIDFCSDLGFTPDCYVERVKALDSFLDNIDLTLDNWKSEYGL